MSTTPAPHPDARAPLPTPALDALCLAAHAKGRVVLYVPPKPREYGAESPYTFSVVTAPREVRS